MENYYVKIISLQAENFKRLRAITITPDGSVVNITGPNDSGKSSTLDAIWAAIGGKDAAPLEPIRQGEQRGVIRLELGASKEEVTYVVTRRFRRAEGREYTTDVTVESPDGARFPSPQKLLDSLMSALCFDPLAFTLMKPADQVDTLRKFVTDFDFVKAENIDRMEYSARTDLNRDLKREQQLADNIFLPKEMLDVIDVEPLEAELKAAYDHNGSIEARKERRADATRQHERLVGEVARMSAQIEQLVRERDTLAKSRDDLKAKIDAAGQLPEKVDTAELEAKLRDVRSLNEKARKAQDDAKRRREHLKTVAELTEKVGILTGRLEARQKDREDAVARAKMPVPGLGFGDGCVLLNGVPFEQASRAQQLRTSLAIAMATNQQLRIALIRDGSLIDVPGRALVAQMAAEAGYQVWMETVDVGTGTVGFVLEDGALKS